MYHGPFDTNHSSLHRDGRRRTARRRRHRSGPRDRRRDGNDRRELHSLRCNSIPVQHTQSVIAEALARDPDLTIVEIAHWLEMCQADFERAFLGKGREGRAKRRVNVANASRLMIALGRAPNELEGC